LKEKIWKLAEDADWVILNDSSRFEVIKVFVLKGRVDNTVWLIDGGVARVKVIEMLIPAELES
jgi:hypothetical protein